MYKKRLEPLEILEKIKLSMKYDMGKTLNENKGGGDILSETKLPLTNNLLNENASKDSLKTKFDVCKKTSEIKKYNLRLSDNQHINIADKIRKSVKSPWGTDEKLLINSLKLIPTKRDFCRVVHTYNSKNTSDLFEDLFQDIGDDDNGYEDVNAALYNAFKYNTPEASNKQAPTKSTIDKKSSTNSLRNTLGVSVLNQILNIKKIKNIRNLSNSVDFLNVANVDGKIRNMASEQVIKLETNGRAKDTMAKYAEALRTDQKGIVGDATLSNYLNAMVSSLNSGGSNFISLFEKLVDVKKANLGDLKRLQQLRYSETTTKLWDEIVKLPFNNINLWLKLAASLDRMKKNGNPNLKFEQQPKKTLVDFSNNYPCLDFGPDNVVGKNEGSKYFIFQKDANGTKYKFYWPILDQGDKGMVFLSKSSGYYGSPSNNTFNTSKDTDTGFKWSCSGSGGIGGSKVIIENMSGNLVEGGWTLPKKKVDNQKDVNTGDVQQKRRSKYQLCSGTYKKGCKDNEGIISKVQGCLGLVADGKFGPKTESAINSKLNRNSFTKTDVDVLCKTEKITEPKPVEPKIVEPKPVEPEVVKITDLENI
jgi:predicted transcriptional regulator